MNWTGVDNAWAFAAVVAFVATNLIVTIGGKLQWRTDGKLQWRKDGKLLDDIHRQTVNDHPEDENLREQMDRMEAQNRRLASAVESQGHALDDIKDRQVEHGKDIRGVRQDVSEIRSEARTDRRDLAEFEGRVQDFIDREYPGAGPL